jgi:regulator of RNase E activity RraB
VRFQSVNSTELDNAVIELFRLAKKHRGDYDGWETQDFAMTLLPLGHAW